MAAGILEMTSSQVQPPMFPVKRTRLYNSIVAAASLCSLACSTPLAAFADGSKLRSPIALASPAQAQMDNSEEACPAQSPKMKLQGKAEVSSGLYTNYNEWQAAQFYKQGVAALQYNQVLVAAARFKQAGDGFQDNPYDGKFFGEARYAEAQCCRVMAKNDRAAMLYGEAVEIFRAYDPLSPYLKAALDQLKLMGKTSILKAAVSKPAAVLKAETPKMDRVQRAAPLEGKITELTGGIDIAALKDEDFFSGGNQLPKAAAVNLSEAYVKDKVYKAFVEMNCVEFNDLVANYYSANRNYHPITSDGKVVIVGASDESGAPQLRLTIGGQPRTISMDLPNMAKSSKNVMVVTDSERVLAIDPRTNDTWKLAVAFKSQEPEFHWNKLTHVKNKQSYLATVTNKRAVSSVFGRK